MKLWAALCVSAGNAHWHSVPTTVSMATLLMPLDVKLVNAMRVQCQPVPVSTVKMVCNTMPWVVPPVNAMPVQLGNAGLLANQGIPQVWTAWVVQPVIV